MDLRRQKLIAYADDRSVFEFDCVTGREGKETTPGTFKIIRKDIDYVSETYGLPMPYSLFFSEDGKAIHETMWAKPRSYAKYVGIDAGSHGCVGLSHTDAKKLFDWAEVGTAVLVQRQAKSFIGTWIVRTSTEWPRLGTEITIEGSGNHYQFAAQGLRFAGSARGRTLVADANTATKNIPPDVAARVRLIPPRFELTLSDDGNSIHFRYGQDKVTGKRVNGVPTGLHVLRLTSTGDLVRQEER